MKCTMKCTMKYTSSGGVLTSSRLQKLAPGAEGMVGKLPGPIWRSDMTNLLAINGYHLPIPIGSMVLPYMVTWIPSIYPSHVSIYTSTMDPMGYDELEQP